MPGFVGLITKMPPERAEQEVLRMVKTTRHESFYETGTWSDKSLGVYVGWTARKGSFCDGMPLCNERNDAVLIFSGEEFPEPETARRLKERGHTFETGGPSYLVHLYEEDPTFPACLNGRFQGILADLKRERVTLFNDRYGMHRVYYHESNEAFYFAAEAKAILAVRPELRKADPRGLGELISCGCVFENRTIFEGIQVLPSGSAWIFRDGSLQRKGTYFEPREWEDQAFSEPEAYYQQFREVFARILPRYFNGREQVGMSLTGGLDTRMIMAWKKPASGSLPCYSFGSMFRDCQDVLVGRRVASACHQPHQVIPLADEFLTNFPRWAERAVYLTDGCVAVNRAADLYVNERAREIAPVRMTGNYGGEVLRRVRAFKPAEPMAGLFSNELVPYIRQAKATYAEVIQGHPLSFALFRQAPWHHYGLLALEETQLSLRTPYLDNEFVQTIFRAPESACANSDVCLRLIADGDTSLRQIRTDRGLGGNGSPVSATVVRNFLEFTFKAEYAYDYGMPQWVARMDHLVAPFHLERLFLGRHKFAHYRVWYRDALSQYVQEVLLDPRTLARPYFERSTVETIVQGHLKGDENHTSEIHTLLTLELIQRLLLDQQ
jgi:asparagine synthase (glutamine-hydrolysing)